jgi:NAD-dependent DNA ligase
MKKILKRGVRMEKRREPPIAYKFALKQTTTQVLDIVVQVGRTGV